MSNKKVIQAGIGYTVGNYLLKGVVFLTSPIFARVLSTSDFGIYNTFAAYESIISIMIGCAIHSSYKNARYKFGLIQEGSKKGKDFDTYVASSMLFIITSCCCWILAVNLFCNPLQTLTGFNRFCLNLLVIYGFSGAVVSCFNSNASLQYRYQSFLKVSACNAVGNIIVSLFLIYLVFPGQKYMGRILGTIIPLFLLAIYISVHFLKKAIPQNIRAFWTWGIKYSMPIVPHGISQVILSQFDRIMINSMIGSSEAGIYSFAYTIFTIIKVTFQSLDNVWCQWFYDQMHTENLQNIRKKSSIYMILILSFSSVLMLISPELIEILGSSKYRQAIYCVIPIVAGGYFTFLYSIPSSVEYYYGKTKYIALGTTSAALINIVLNYFFISRTGYISAAYTTLFTYVLYFCFHYFLAWKIQKGCLFSNKVVFTCCLLILTISGIAIILIPYFLLRWGIALVLAVITLLYEEHYIGFLVKYTNRYHQK